MTRSASSLLFGVLPALLLAIPATAVAASYHKIVDGVTIDWGLMPGAAIARSGTASERAMHGGTERGNNIYHLTVALSSTASGRQIGNARVEAEMYQAGSSGEWKPMQAMRIDNTVTYGDYFRMNEASPLPYRIAIRIRLPQRRGVITTELTHYHD